MAKATKKEKKEVFIAFPVKTTFWRRGVEHKKGSTIELSNEKTIEYFKTKKYI